MQIAIATDMFGSDVFRLVVGEIILIAGLGALVLYGIRSRTTDRSTLHFGIVSTLYGLRLIFGLQMLKAAFPSIPWLICESSITLVIGIPFALFLGSTLGRAYPWFVRAVVIANILLAVFGAVREIQQAHLDQVSFLNGAIVVTSLVGWLYIGIFPKIPINREVHVLRIGLMVLGLFALFQNLSVMGYIPDLGYFEPVGMVVMLGTFLYVSASRNLRMESSFIAMRNELSIASKIQSDLLPKLDNAMAGLEIHARYSPAGSVAGDFYDVLTDGHGLGVLIADVSGHGVPAALSASMLKVALHAQAAQFASPGEVLAGLNRALSGMLGSQFITAAYVYFDTGQQELRYAGAGHPPILLWSSKTRRVESLEENGLFLGPFPAARYTSRSCPFEPGDRCLLYTDGVVEASNANDEEFGAARLTHFLADHPELPASSICSALLREVTGWSGRGLESQQDDITLVSIECQPIPLPVDEDHVLVSSPKAVLPG
ncbi:MAG TPA: PP2C family protein-serine/threonine phosphatase [Terracidiphilus sp.]|nr:PP2C family protein-serine/threonine phosphatase [Terracidiphilus sp.]